MAENKTKFVSVDGAGDSNIKFVRASKLEGPQVVAEGIYAGTIPNKFEETKQDYKIESLETDENGNKRITIVNSAGNLGYRMAKVKVGDLIQIKYEGKMLSQKGKSKGKMVHNFEVLRAED